MSIALASVDTAIAVRDQRMREYLFEVAGFPAATLQAPVDLEPVMRLSPGESQTQSLSLSLSLHGQEKQMPAVVRVTRLDQAHVRVDTVRPLILQASDYGLAPGIAKLAELASLPMISMAVPVTVSLVFAQQP